MVVGFELLVKDSDAVPKLGVLDIFERIKSVLISVECAVTLFCEEVAVTKGSP